MNSIVSELRFLVIHTLDRPDLARRLVRLAYRRNLPLVLSREKIARLLTATTCPKHQAALSVAYGAGLRVAEVSMLKSPTSTASACCGVEPARTGAMAMPCSPRIC